MTDRDEAPGGPAFGVPPEGHRLPPETRPGSVRLQVADLERSLAWYDRVLGLPAVDRSAGRAALSVPGRDEPLVELLERPGAAPDPGRGRLGLYHFAILLPTRDDLARFLRHLRALGERAGAADHHVSEALYLRDPDGLGVEVYADRPRSQWEADGRELRIDTSPLDEAGLVRTAGDRPWEGMPAGTAIGHVHLRVGDLDEASAFYHGALGLDRMTWSYPGALFLAAGGYHHHLGLNSWAGPDATPPEEGDARLLEWELVVPSPGDVAAAARGLEDAGYAVVATGRGWSARDPWGTPVRLLARDDRTAAAAD